MILHHKIKTVTTWKRPIVVVGFGEAQGEAKGEGWWDPPRALSGNPSTTSPPCSPLTFREDAEPLCSVFSGLERAEEDEVEDEDEDEDVVEEDSVQAGSLGGGSAVAKDT